MMEYGGIYLTNMSGNGIDHRFRQMMINQLSSPVEGYRVFRQTQCVIVKPGVVCAL